ncbi:MAG: hypothetical protein Kow0059_05220 [Candidatus Sumerlaeia bacterium]
MELELLSLLMVLFLAWVAGAATNRVGYPAILGELGAGVVFGPALLGAVALPAAWPVVGGIHLGFPEPPAGLNVLAQVGVFLLMLYIGMEVDFRDLLKAKTSGLAASLGSFITPFAVGFFLSGEFGLSLQDRLFVGLAMSVTSLATKSRILLDLNLFGTRVANVLLAGALIADTAVLIAFAVILGLAGQEGLDVARVLVVAVKAVLFFALAAGIGRFALPGLGGVVNRLGMTHRTSHVTILLLVGLVFAELAHLLGLHAVIGAFLAGMFLREGVWRRKLSHEIMSIVRDMSLGFLAPIFFIMAGFQVSLAVIVERPMLVLSVVAAATLSKIVGSALFYTLSGHSWREGVVIGTGMNARGGVDIVVAEIALGLGLITRDIFSVLVIMAFVTTLTVPVLLTLGTNWLKRRDELKRIDADRRGAVIVGASPLARQLAVLLRRAGGSVYLIDNNRDRCAAARREGLNVIRGNALNDEVLDAAGARDARYFLAMTSNQEVNALAARMAHDYFAIPRIFTVKAAPAQAGGGAEGTDGSAKSPTFTPLFPASTPLDEWDKRLLRKQCRTDVVPVSAPVSAAEFLDPLYRGGRSLPLVIEHDKQLILPAAAEALEPGDKVIVLRYEEEGDPLAARFDQLVRECPILDIQGPIEARDFFVRVAEVMTGRLGVDAEELTRRLLEREKESTTVLVRGLAVPHVTVEGEKLFDMLIARCREGVRFLEEGATANIIFVLFGSRDDRNMHLRTLSIIAQFMQDPKFESRWLEASGAEGLRQVIQQTGYRRV